MRSTQRRQAHVPDEEPRLIREMVSLATQYGRYGYRRVTALLRDRGWRVNHKRVERLWRQEGLKVPKRQPKRKRLWLNDGSCVRLSHASRSPIRSCRLATLRAGLGWLSCRFNRPRRAIPNGLAERALDNELLAFDAGASVVVQQYVEVVVVDVDGGRVPFAIPNFNGPFGGNGETAWIVEGKVVASTFGIVDRGVFARKLARLRAPDAPEPEPEPVVSSPRRVLRRGLHLAGVIQIIAGSFLTAAGLAVGSPAAAWGVLPIGVGLWVLSQRKRNT